MVVLSVMVVIAMSSLVLSGYYSLLSVRGSIRHADLFDRQTTNLQAILRGITENVLIPDNPQSANQARAALADFRRNLGILKSDESDQQLLDTLNKKVWPEWLVLEKQLDAFLQISRPSYEDVDTMIEFGKISARTDNLLKMTIELRDTANQHSSSHIKTMIISMAVIAVSLIIVTMAVMTSIFRSIALPLEEVTASAESISKGRLNTRLTVRRDDEIGRLATSFNHMTDNLQQMIGQSAGISAEVSQAANALAVTSHQVVDSVAVQKGAIETTSQAIVEVNHSIVNLEKNSARLFEAASSTSSVATELATTTQQVAANAVNLDMDTLKAVENLKEMSAAIAAIVTTIDNFSGFAEETCQAMEQISITVKNVQNSASQTVAMAEQASNSASVQGLGAIRDAQAGVENIRKNVTDLTGAVNSLGSRSQQIGKIITVIEDIASQTRLLALNASILAAQAGPHGNSFAVVAGEIRALAERTFLSTKEIIDVITAVQSEADTSIKMANNGMEAVQKGVTLMDLVRVALDNIHKDSLASTDMSRTIYQETISETEIIDRVTASITTLRTQIEGISDAVRNQSASTRSMNWFMEQLKSVSKEIAVATRDQSTTSHEISRISNELLQQSEEINSAITSQKQKSDAIVAAIGSIHETSLKLAVSAQTINQTTDALVQKASDLNSSIKRFEV